MVIFKGQDDGGMLPYHLDTITSLLDSAGFTDNYRIIYYPGTGHLIRPPYIPVHRVVPTHLGKSSVVTLRVVCILVIVVPYELYD